MAKKVADNPLLLRFNTLDDYQLPLPGGWEVQVSPPLPPLMDYWDLYVYDQSEMFVGARVKLDTFEAQCVLMALMDNPQEVTREEE
jgi:hypothetical protein